MMSTVSALFYLVAIASIIDGSEIIWFDSAATDDQFMTSGSVDFQASQYCPDGCAQITATWTASYLETVAIDTSGYDDIYITCSFALTDWTTQSSFFVYYSTDSGDDQLRNIHSVTQSAYGLNQQYIELKLKYANNSETLYIRFSAETADLNVQSVVYVYNLSVFGTAMPIITSPPSYDPSAAPTKNPITLTTDSPTTSPSSAPSVGISNGTILATERSDIDDAVIVTGTTNEGDSGFML